jgi:hypothetical protein
MPHLHPLRVKCPHSEAPSLFNLAQLRGELREIEPTVSYRRGPLGGFTRPGPALAALAKVDSFAKASDAELVIWVAVSLAIPNRTSVGQQPRDLHRRPAVPAWRGSHVSRPLANAVSNFRDCEMGSLESRNITTTKGLESRSFRGGDPMAQIVVSWFVSSGRFRVHAINAVGRRKGRIIEVEEVDTGERFHGSARKCSDLWTR